MVLVGFAHLVPDIGGKLCQYQWMGSIVGKEIAGQVVKLLDIAGIIVVHQEVKEAGGQDVPGHKAFVVEQLPEEQVHEQRDILPAFPEGQGVDGSRIQQEEQFFAECALLYQLVQILPGCGDDAHIKGGEAGSEDISGPVVLKNVNQNPLNLGRQVLGAVNEQGTVVGLFEQFQHLGERIGYSQGCSRKSRGLIRL